MKLMNSIKAGLVFLSYQFKFSKLPYSPRIVYIEPTNICNLQCVMCPEGRMTKYRKRTQMDMDLFEKILNQLKEIKPLIVSFHLSGEPLLNKNLPLMVKKVKEIGIDTNFSSNGMLLDKETAEKLIDAQLDLIRIDFYSDKEKFESLRKGAKWETVRDNIKQLIELKKEKKSHKPMILIQSLRFKNEDPTDNSEVENIKKIFPELDSGNVVVFEAHSFSGEFADDTKEDERFKVDRDPSKYYPCRHAWGGIAITCNGTVVPCCRDILGSYVLGNVNENTIMEIWNGEKFTELRRLQAEGKYDQITLCKNCTALWEGFKPTHLIINHFKKMLRFHKERKKAMMK